MNQRQLAIETHDLTRRFGNFIAVNRVNFYIPQGEIFGLLGPNGAGKTTIIRMLCGILTPTCGSATVLGFDVTRQPEQIKQRIGYMSQRFALYNDLTPRENLTFYASVYGVPSSERGRRVDELIEMIDLQEQQNTLTRNLSGAWRQRLALACAIAHKPPLLFLDEPTAGVDPISRRQFWDLIYHMAGEGVSVLVTTHYMDEAEYCNTIGMMYQGELIALASPDTLRDQMPTTLFQIDCENLTEAEQVLRRLPEVSEVSINGLLLHVMAKSAKAKEPIEAALAQSNITVRSLEMVIPSLEDIFIYLVEQRQALNHTASPTHLSEE